MKNLAQILAFSLVFGLVLVVPATAEEAPAPMTTELAASADVAPTEVPPRPDPVFLAGSNAGGAGGLQTGLVNGEASGLPSNRIFYDDHFCCPYGATGCDCSYLSGFTCDPIGCPKRTQPNCT
jgi:hypothetical protein